jgi:hypothetical protein
MTNRLVNDLTDCINNLKDTGFPYHCIIESDKTVNFREKEIILKTWCINNIGTEYIFWDHRNAWYEYDINQQRGFDYRIVFGFIRESSAFEFAIRWK